MAHAMSARDEINTCKYFFLSELSEPGENELRLVIEEAAVGESEQIVEGSLRAYPIDTSPQSRVFELNWPAYIAYAVRNESHAVPSDKEIYEGKLLRRFSTSHFLDYVRVSTNTSDLWPGSLQHWEMVCLNHVIDVVAVDDPEIVKLNRQTEAPRS
jgi:hypothetical protein